MGDIIKKILVYLQEEYQCPHAYLQFGYNMKVESKVVFMLPNYPIIIELNAKELIDINKRYGTKRTIQEVDGAILKLILEYRRKYSDDEI